MDLYQKLKSSLDEIALHGPELLRHLDTESHNGSSGQTTLSSLLEDTSRSSIQYPRKKLIESATKLLQLATTADGYLEHLANSYQELTCVRWLVDLNVLHHLPATGSIAYTTLAADAGVPVKHLKGVARMAVVNGFLEEPLPGHVAHSRASSLLLRDDNFMSWARWMMNYSMPVAYRFADATRRWGDTDAKDQTAFNLALDTPDPFFDHIRKNAELTSVFSDYMRNVTASRSWSLAHAVESFDWGSLPDGAKVVDVGGSHGQLAAQVATKFPRLKFIVQDLPETVAAAQKAFEADEKLDAAVKSQIQFMSHDFFKAQPVVDADVYFLRMIIHDWPDRDARIILQQLREVLEKRPNARVVIMDTLLPPPGSTTVLHEQQLRVRDLMMMQVFNARERELDDWKVLLNEVGMQITHLEQPEDSVMGLLTVQLKPTTNGNPVKESASDLRNGCTPKSPITPTSADQPVLIIGAGISGLCLAQALRKSQIPFRVYERDPAVDSRPQGYRLKLQGDAAEALSDILPNDVYEMFQTSCATLSIGETDLDPFTGMVIKSRSGGGLSGKIGLNPHYCVDRSSFRKILMADIEQHIFFGKELDSYKTDAERGVVTATFRDGHTVKGRFIVGADGLHSVIRRNHIPKSLLKDTGAACIYGKTPLTPEVLAKFPEKGVRWMTVVSDHAPMLQSCFIGDSPVTLLLEPIRFSKASRSQHSLPEDYLYWALIGPEPRFRFPDGTSASKVGGLTSGQVLNDAANLSLAITEEWHPSVRCVFELQDTRQATLIRVVSSVPDVPAWQPSSMVTVLGDAVHPMSPCGGIGAQTAICDAASLAKILTATQGSPSSQAVGAFEEGMRNRAHRSIKHSEVGSQKMFGLRSLADCKPWTGC
ncbi:O-methyltransferase aurJ [Colletotrichum siamense]|uniref:O-methyltransferase aurJ n=1 Tax=Colletotrichum siamense TaxID=690259 RepID=UPI001872ECB3|nr:O-methyltransferase aurJ [Colletotrichum siamense]KAF5516137.1 O-methyltransferase aurJ [Colletotrichum siamense]